MASNQVQITDGPSKLDLMLALFDKKHAKYISFRMSGGIELRIYVLSVQKQDSSCESWNIEGYVDIPGNHAPRGAIPLKDARKFYYRTDKRTGTISF